MSLPCFSQAYCVDCERSYCNIQHHYSTQKHQRNVEASVRAHAPPLECEICNLPRGRTDWMKCKRCVHFWCTECDRRMTSCPFCRLNITVLDPEVRRLFRQMERWRRRYDSYLHHPAVQTVMVRLTWREVGILTSLIMRHPLRAT